MSVAHQRAGTEQNSKLKLLVPAVSKFFTPLVLHDAFVYQDQRRFISHRRFVAPSFNDVRLILNTAQVMSLVRAGPLDLITFDGDVTLYDDGQSLVPENSVIPRIMGLLRKGTRIGIVTAAGYTEGARYYERLHGLLDAIRASDMPTNYKQNLIVMGGESSYLFKYSADENHLLQWVPRKDWILEEMRSWTEDDIRLLLDVAETALRECVKNMRLSAQIIRKERAVGIVPANPGGRFAREQLEETVLVTQKILEMSEVGRRLPFCAFNGELLLPRHVKSLCLTRAQKVETTSSSTLATNHGVSSLASASSAASRAARRFTLVINSFPPAPTISRLALPVLRLGSPTRQRHALFWMRSLSWTRCNKGSRCDPRRKSLNFPT